MKKIVSKFGGTSMADIPAMQKAARIVISRSSVVTVVSATSGTTNQLIDLSKTATLSSKWNEVQQRIDFIKSRHQDMIDKGQFIAAQPKLDSIIEEMISISKGIFYLKDCSAKALDMLMSVGERLSSLIFFEVLKAQIKSEGLHSKVELLDVRKFLITESQFGQARPKILESEVKFQELAIHPKEIFYVTQGFLGATVEGFTTTLGRGGSDFSAALIAEALRVDELEIWTDVDGIATTDPRLCAGARRIEMISFQEASEMATFGAKVLHPATLAPAIRHNIPVFVGSTFSPESGGTWVKKTIDDAPVFRAVVLRKNQILLTLTNPEMLQAHGFLFQIFKVFNDHQISIDAITTSEISVSLTLDNSTKTNSILNESLVRELKSFAEVNIEENLALVAVIGNKIPHTKGVAQKVFSILEGINIRMICLGASQQNLNLLVHEDFGAEAIRRLHRGLGFEE